MSVALPLVSIQETTQMVEQECDEEMGPVFRPDLIMVPLTEESGNHQEYNEERVPRVLEEDEGGLVDIVEDEGI